MIEYIPTASKKHFLLLNIRININFQSPSVIKNPNKNKLFDAFTFNDYKSKKMLL